MGGEVRKRKVKITSLVNEQINDDTPKLLPRNAPARNNMTSGQIYAPCRVIFHHYNLQETHEFCRAWAEKAGYGISEVTKSL